EAESCQQNHSRAKEPAAASFFSAQPLHAKIFIRSNSLSCYATAERRRTRCHRNRVMRARVESRGLDVLILDTQRSLPLRILHQRAQIEPAFQSGEACAMQGSNLRLLACEAISTASWLCAKLR